MLTKPVNVNGVEVTKIFFGQKSMFFFKEEYLTNSVMENKTGRGLANDFVGRKQEQVESVCCQRRLNSSQTGWKDCMFSHVVRNLHKNLLLVSCILHDNDLPFLKRFNSFNRIFVKKIILKDWERN